MIAGSGAAERSTFSQNTSGEKTSLYVSGVMKLVGGSSTEVRSSELQEEAFVPPANPCKLRRCAERWPSGAGTTPLARRKLQHLVFRPVFA